VDEHIGIRGGRNDVNLQKIKPSPVACHLSLSGVFGWA
jgi:hypothetical protein